MRSSQFRLLTLIVSIAALAVFLAFCFAWPNGSMDQRVGLPCFAPLLAIILFFSVIMTTLVKRPK